jgi:nicotinate-nucleotide adenylyltransferase
VSAKGPERAPSPAPKSAGARRIGLFGGTFDPVHSGHLHAARRALEAFDLDRVVFVPAGRSPYKLGQPLTAGEHRLAMLERAIAGEPRFSISAIELERAGPSYTIDTVRALPRAIGEAPDVEMYLIVGSDNLPGLPGWREVHTLLERVHPIVVHREGEPDVLLDEIERDLGQSAAAKLRAGYLRLPPVVVSSTALRAGLPSLAIGSNVLPASVLEYIRAHGLYGAAR